MTLLAANFEDPERARVIYLAAGGLVVVALLVVVGTVWWWRSAAVEHPSLGPLEVMGSKSWWKGDESDRLNRLESVRPDGAEPGDMSLIVPDPVDLLDTDRTRPIDFDDLVGLPEEEAAEDWRRSDIRRDVPVPIRSRVLIDPLMRSNDDY